MSPTIYQEQGYIFYFKSFDVASGEPAHVHVGEGRPRPRGDAKIWLEPVSVASSGRFGRIELRRILQIVDENRMLFLGDWNDYRTRIQN